MSIESSLKSIDASLKILVANSCVPSEEVPVLTKIVSPAPETVANAKSPALTDDTPVVPDTVTTAAPAPTAEAAPAPTAEAAPAPTAEATPAPTAEATPAPTAEATPAPTMTGDELNNLLVAEFQRLGSREPIDRVMREEPFSVQSIHDIRPDQYDALLIAVRAVAV